MTLLRPAIAVGLLLLAGCAGRMPVPVPVAVLPLTPLAPPMPAGAYPGMAIPVAYGDGSYPTPNRGLSRAASIWHLRAGLNVAALACRGNDAAMIAGYNAMLIAHKALLKQAEATLAAEYRAAGGSEWRDGYDDAMTRLYNFWAQSFAHKAFCASASEILAEAALVDAAAFPDFAAARLATLDRAFTDYYRAYDAWRHATRPGMTIAAARNVPVGVQVAPRIEINVAALF